MPNPSQRKQNREKPKNNPKARKAQKAGPFTGRKPKRMAKETMTKKS